MSTEAIILIGVSVYLLAMIAVGVAVARRSGTEEEFLVAGRKFPLWICAPTIVATWFGSGTMMGSAGTGYEGGFLASISIPFGSALVLILIGFFFVRTVRRMRLLTVAEYFENRFGRVSGVVAAVALLLAITGWIGGTIVAFGHVLQTLTGVPMSYGILIGGAIVIAYTAIGGMWAVALTDFIQVLIIIVGLVVLLFAVLSSVGGWGAIAPRLPDDAFRLVPHENNFEVWLNYLRLWIIFGIADIASQSLMQRTSAAKSEQTAQNSFYLAGIGYLTLGLIPVTLGIIASVTMPGLADPETVIPRLALEHLHPVVIAVFVGAILAAIMSTADSGLLAAASLISVNIAPIFRTNITKDQKLFVTRAAIPVLGIISVYVALEVQAVIEIMLDANAFLLVGVACPYIAGIWWSKANRTGALSAMTAGMAAWFLTSWFYPALAGDVIGFGVSIVTIVIVSLLTQKADPPWPLIDGNGDLIDLNDRFGTLPLFGSLKSNQVSSD